LYREFLDALGARPRWNIVADPPLRLVSLASVEYLWTAADDTTPGNAGLPLVYTDTVTRIYQNTNALPRAYIARQWQNVASPRQALEIMQTGGDLRSMPACVEGLPSASADPVAAQDATTGVIPARIVVQQPRRVRVELPESGAGILVLNDLYAPGWSARSAAGVKIIRRVNGAFRGVALTPADRWIEFRYRPASFIPGAILSLLGLSTLGLQILKNAAAIPLKHPNLK
jgi:hypothetical protein